MSGATIDSGMSESVRAVGELFDSFLDDCGSVDAAVLIGVDGLPLVWTGSMPTETVDQFATLLLGFHTMAASTAACLACEQVERQLVELDSAFVVIDTIGSSGVLGVVADRRGDIGAIAYETTLLAERLESRLDDSLVAELANRVER